MTTKSGVNLHVAAQVAYLELNRPDKLNALDETMIAELAKRCAEIEHQETIAVVILSGKGNAFCAGGDIDAWSNLSPRDFGRHWVREGHAAFDALARLRQPVIAVIDGHAFGGGLELAACADYRIAEAHVNFSQPEAKLGVIPGWSGTQRTVRRFGAQSVRRMALFGEIFSAEQAVALGIADQCVPTGDGMKVADKLAANVCNRSPVSTELCKMMINAADGEERERVMEAIAGTVAAGSQELAEGLSEFRARKSNRDKKARP